jgi:hypothetical protein
MNEWEWIQTKCKPTKRIISSHDFYVQNSKIKLNETFFSL